MVILSGAGFDLRSYLRPFWLKLGSMDPGTMHADWNTSRLEQKASDSSGHFQGVSMSRGPSGPLIHFSFMDPPIEVFSYGFRS